MKMVAFGYFDDSQVIAPEISKGFVTPCTYADATHTYSFPFVNTKNVTLRNLMPIVTFQSPSTQDDLVSVTIVGDGGADWDEVGSKVKIQLAGPTLNELFIAVVATDGDDPCNQGP